MPDNQSKEKMDTLRALGAELVLVPPTKFSNPGHFVHTSRRLAEETEGAVWANQFDNIANRKAHIEGHRGRAVGADGRRGSTASPARSAPAARWPASAWGSRSATKR
jgi:cysteine synthase